MRIYDVLYAMNTGDATPKARPFDNLLGQALSGGTEEKTIDFTPVISVSDAKAGNALDYQCKITATQSGTGDPSPTNIRPISGFTGANISVNGSTVAVSWLSEAGTVYGGVLDVTTGALSSVYVPQTYDGSETGWRVNSFGNGYYIPLGSNDYDLGNPLICDCLLGMNAGSSSSMPNNAIRMNGNRQNLLVKVDTTTDFPSVDDWKAFLTQNPMTVLFPLAEPITYNLTPTEITLSEGTNTIWADCGDSKMTYLAKK